MRGCNPRCRFICNSGSLTMSEWSGGKTECHSCQMIGNTGQLWGNYQVGRCRLTLSKPRKRLEIGDSN